VLLVWFVGLIPAVGSAPLATSSNAQPLARRGKEFPLPTPGAGPVGIVAGPDGSVWFTEADADAIGRRTASGRIQEFPIGAFHAEPFGASA
jgi:streptogramin lyase